MKLILASVLILGATLSAFGQVSTRAIEELLRWRALLRGTDSSWRPSNILKKQSLLSLDTDMANSYSDWLCMLNIDRVFSSRANSCFSS
jgi:hypothetical protein